MLIKNAMEREGKKTLEALSVKVSKGTLVVLESYLLATNPCQYDGI